MVNDVTPEEAMKIANETKLLFIDCWAPWCGPCKALTPILESLDEDYADDSDVGFVKVNTQDHMPFAMENNIVAIPCVLVFFEGKPANIEIANPSSGEKTTTDRLVGLRPYEAYEEVIEKLL